MVFFQTDQCFTMRDGLYVSGMSSEALQNLLEDFLTCGMYYYRLEIFSEPAVMNSFYTNGLTFQAFTGKYPPTESHRRFYFFDNLYIESYYEVIF